MNNINDQLRALFIQEYNENSFNEELIKNDVFSLEKLEECYQEVLIDQHNIGKFYNNKQFNIYIFEIEKHGNTETKKMVLYILKSYLQSFTITSRVLMFNLLECVVSDIKLNVTELKDDINSIMDCLTDNYDLFITSGHHPDIAKYIGLKMCHLCEPETRDIVKNVELLKKYVNIICKHEKKIAKRLLKNFADGLFFTEHIFKYIEALTILLSVEDLKLKTDFEWIQTLSKFLCHALKIKNFQKADAPLHAVMKLLSATLKKFSVSWLPTTNETCNYHSEKFLIEFAIEISTFTSLIITSVENPNFDAAALFTYAEALEVLLSFLSSINSDDDQDFSEEEERLILVILAKVSQYQTYLISRIDEMTSEIKFDDLFFLYLRSYWIANAILGKEVRIFLNTLKKSLKILTDKFATILSQSDNFTLTSDDRILVAGVCIDLLNIFEDVLRAEFEGDVLSYIEPVVMTLLDSFYKLLVFYVSNADTEELYIIGIVNALNLFAYSVSIVENEEFVAKVDRIVTLLMTERNKIRNDSVKTAMVNLMLQFYGHDDTNASINVSDLMDLFVWASKQTENSEEMKENLTQGLEAFFEKYENMKPIFDAKLEIVN